MEINLGYAMTLRRVMLEMSRADVADTAGVSYPFYCEVENGKKCPSWESLTSLSSALRFDRLSEFLRFAEDVTATKP